MRNKKFKFDDNSSSDDIDYENYKGVFCSENQDEEGEKYIDPITGAHFNYKDICNRLYLILNKNLNHKKEEEIKDSRNNRNQSTQAHYYVTNVFNYNMPMESKLNVSFNNCLMSQEIDHNQKQERNRSLGLFKFNTKKRMNAGINLFNHTRNLSEIGKMTNNSRSQYQGEYMINNLSSKYSNNLSTTYVKDPMKKGFNPNEVRPHSSTKMEIDSKDLAIKYFNKTRNIQEFLENCDKKTFENPQKASHHTHNLSLEINNHLENRLNLNLNLIQNKKPKISQLVSKIKKVNLNLKSRSKQKNGDRTFNKIMINATNDNKNKDRNKNANKSLKKGEIKIDKQTLQLNSTMNKIHKGRSSNFNNYKERNKKIKVNIIGKEFSPKSFFYLKMLNRKFK